MANKLTTMGYFMKRLKDSGYVVDKVFNGYSMIDSRSWTVIVDPGCASVFITCYHNDPEIGRSYFEMYDGGKFVPGRVKLETSSIETFIGYLVKFGVSNKSRSYPSRLDNNK
jgi:hypothetical protein